MGHTVATASPVTFGHLEWMAVTFVRSLGSFHYGCHGHLIIVVNVIMINGHHQSSLSRFRYHHIRRRRRLVVIVSAFLYFQDPCHSKERHACPANSFCVPEGTDYKCYCTHPYQWVGKECRMEDSDNSGM